MGFSLIQNKTYCWSAENLILCYIFPYSTRLLGFPVPWCKSALSWSNPFDTEVVNKTLIDLRLVIRKKNLYCEGGQALAQTS